jgi:DUF1365 family protein
MHRRLRPRVHRFRYRAFWCLFNLDELPELSRRLRLFSHDRGNLFSLRTSDHGDGSHTPLRTQAERLLAAAGVGLSGGTIQLLCMPRTLGYCFNPISVYFCHRQDGQLAALIYQVHNTFGERHSYVIPTATDGSAPRQHCRKRFYVSPFLDMDMRYDFRVTGPDDRISLGISGSDSGTPVISAVMTGQRRALSDSNLLRLALTIPAITMKTIAAIHWEAFRLWLKGMRLRPRPHPPAPVTVTSARTD